MRKLIFSVPCTISRPDSLRFELLQMQDSMLLDGKLREYQRAFQAVDTSGNGTLGAVAPTRVSSAV